MDITLQNKETESFRVSKPIVWIVIMAILYIARDVLGVGFPQSIFTVLCLIAFLTTSIEESLCIFIFTTALALPGNEIRLVYFITFLMKQKSVVRRLKLSNLLILLIMINEFIVSSYYYSGSNIRYIYIFSIYALYLLIPILWNQYDFSKKSIVAAIKCFVIGIILSAFVTLFLAVRYRGWSVILSGSNSLGEIAEEYVARSGMVTSNNRNGLAIQAVIAISFILVLLSNGKAKIIPSIAALATLLMIVLLTRSRTGTLMVVLIIIYWVLLISLKRGQLKSGLLIIGSIALLLFCLHHFLPDAWNGVFARFVNQKDISNGRLYWNSVYIECWKNNAFSFLLGYGKNTYNSVLDLFTSPHNMIVDVLTCSGLVGLVCLLIWLILFLKDSLVYVDKTKLPYALLTPFIYFVSTMSGQYFTVTITHIFFTFILLSPIALGKEDMD